ARRLLIGGALVAALGTFLFASTGSYGLAAIGRLIVGGSTAIGWVVTLKIATHWFPPASFATMSGLGLFMGNIGALFAQVPLRMLVERFGWRAVAAGSGGVVLAVGAAASAFVAVAAMTSVACGAVIIGFAYAKESVPVRFLGTISGAVNVGNMIGPTILQPAIGTVLDARWSGQMSGGVRTFSVEAYHAAFAMI